MIGKTATQLSHQVTGMSWSTLNVREFASIERYKRV
jgi:hypothetical protein